MNKDNIYVKYTKNKRKSIFAKINFKKGEIVFLISGHIVKRPSIYTIPIDYNIFIDPISMAGKELCHSCNPNCGINNKIEVVAMRDIKKDEEINIDYAMIVYDYGEEMSDKNIICKCGSIKCRGKLGSYIRLSRELRKKYDGYISEYLIK